MNNGAIHATKSPSVASAPATRNLVGDSEVLFKHLDASPALDTINSMEDPVQEFAAKLFKLGAVIKGHGTGIPPGSAVTFGDVTVPNIFVAARHCAGECFAAISWDAARAVYLNPKVYSSRVFQETFGLWGPLLVTLDPPEHTKYRMMMNRAFTPTMMQSYKDNIINPIIRRRFADLKPQGKADLVRDLTAFYAYEIVGAVVGFDVAEISYVATCFAQLHRANVDLDGATRASANLKAYAKGLIDGRRRDPKQDLISTMIGSVVAGESISEDMLVGLVNTLLSGGIDTIAKQSGNVIYLLLQHPEQFDLLRKERALIPRFVEEALRYEGIGGVEARQATEDTNLQGMSIPKGAVVFTLHGVTDRDPSRWSDPNRFDVLREPKPHIKFSSGPHSCIGAGIARATLAALIEHLIDDLPDLRWDSTKPRPRITGWTQRTPTALPVVWD